MTHYVHKEHESAEGTVRYYLNIVAEEDAHAEAIAALDSLLARLEAAERGWQEAEHPFDKSEFDAMFARAEAAEARLQTVTRAVWDALAVTDRIGGPCDWEGEIRSILRAALAARTEERA